MPSIIVFNPIMIELSVLYDQQIDKHSPHHRHSYFQGPGLEGREHVD